MEISYPEVHSARDEVSYYQYAFRCISYASNLEPKQKGKACFACNPTRRTSDNKSSIHFKKSKHPSQPTSLKLDYHKKKF